MKIWARWFYIHLSVAFPECQQDRTLLQPILLSENIPNIWHNYQQNTRRSDQIETIKTDNANYAPRITWKVLPMAQVAIFKEISLIMWKDLDCELFYSELKRHNVSHYIYYLATDNIHTLENDNTVLIKGLKKVVNVNSQENTHLIETSYMIGWNQEKSHFKVNTGKILLKQEFSDGLQISMNIKDITIPLIIHYYLSRAFRTLHKSFHRQIITSGFFRVSTGALA